MTAEQKVVFDSLNELWLIQIQTAKYHLDIACSTLKANNPVNSKLFKLEQEYGVKRKTNNE